MQKDTLILGLGNELLSDDGIGVVAVRKLQELFSKQADFVSTSEAGMALLDHFIGYKKAIIIDAIFTENGNPGDVHELTPEDLDSVIAPSPHFAGLPEIWDIASKLELEFPTDIKIYALEVADPFTLGGEISEKVMNTIPRVIELVTNQIKLWSEEIEEARALELLEAEV